MNKILKIVLIILVVIIWIALNGVIERTTGQGLAALVTGIIAVIIISLIWKYEKS